VKTQNMPDASALELNCPYQADRIYAIGDGRSAADMLGGLGRGQILLADRALPASNR
jgi:hypothetical protein